MPKSDGQIYSCHDCENRGSYRNLEPLKPEDLGVIEEKDIRKPEIGARVLGIVFAARAPGSHRATMPVLVMGRVEIRPDQIGPGFTRDVMERYANCYGPIVDGSCGGVNSCELARLLIKHLIKQPDQPE